MAGSDPDKRGDVSNASAVITITISAVGLVDKLYDPVYLCINKRPDPGDKPEHRFKIEGNSQKIVVKQWGKEIQTITADDLKNLPATDHDLIKTYEKSMQAHYLRWQNVYPKRNSSPDKLKNEETDKEISRLIVDMEEDLNGIIRFLEFIGVRLDDHYKNIRHLVMRFRMDSQIGQSA